MAEQVAALANVSLEVAQEALATHKEVWLAVDALMDRPVVSGDKYIPTAPKIDVGLSDEQRERCERGRWLQDKVNAVFSVAHSKIQNQSAPQLDSPPPAVADVTIPSVPPSSE